MLNYIQGNLFDYDFTQHDNTLIAHIVNDKKAWGAGFVIPLAKFIPKAKEQYRNWNPVLGKVQIINAREKVFVANMCAQTLGGERPLFYNHLVKCMEKVADFAIVYNATICCPLFGSGLAGGNWNFIHELITDIWVGQDIDVKAFFGVQY